MPRGGRYQRPCSVLPMNHLHRTLTAVLGGTGVLFGLAVQIRTHSPGGDLGFASRQEEGR